MKSADRYGINAVADVTRRARPRSVALALAFDGGATIGACALAFRAARSVNVVARDDDASVANPPVFRRRSERP